MANRSITSESKIVEEKNDTPLKRSKNVLTKNNKTIATVLIIVIVLSGLFLAKSLFVAAIVNNQPITTLSFIRELEKKDGKATLDNMVVEMLVFQEAKKQKVQISSQDVDSKLKEIEASFTAQGQKLDDVLVMQGETREGLKRQIELQLIVEKILGKDISISDKQISDSFNTNLSSYPKGTKLEDKKDEIKATLTQQALSDKIQPWINDLKTKSKILQFIKL